MRRDEVDTECYLINRGTCKLCEYSSGNNEPPTMTTTMVCEDDISSARRLRYSSTYRPAHSMGPMRGNETEASVLRDGIYSRVNLQRRGQAIREMALLANCGRSSDLRAVAYVEMCVIDRNAFQKLLTRYPRVRAIVVASIMRHSMLSLAMQGVPCPYMKMVKRFKPDATVMEAIEYVSTELNPPRDDPTILFGMSTQAFGRLQRQFASTQSEKAVHDTVQTREVADLAPRHPTPSLPSHAPGD